LRILPAHVIPIFLKKAAIGELGAQVRFFDAYYKEPPIVGFHVLGEDPPTSDITGFVALSPLPPEENGICFIAEEKSSQNDIIAFSAESSEELPAIAGFDVTASLDDNAVAGFVAEDSHEEETIAGFIAEDLFR